MADLTNAQIAAAFDELGDLYELDGADSYRVIAYRNAARPVRDAAVSVAEMTRDGRATELIGIGKTLEDEAARARRRRRHPDSRASCATSSRAG